MKLRIPVYPFAGPASNHEEPMDCVTPQLVDEAYSQIEVGLHRAGREIEPS